MRWRLARFLGGFDGICVQKEALLIVRSVVFRKMRYCGCYLLEKDSVLIFLGPPSSIAVRHMDMVLSSNLC